MDKLLISILTGISPIFFSFLIKIFENKRELTIHKNRLEEAQSRMNFIDSYFQLQSKFIGETELIALKEHLTAELAVIKKTVDVLYIKTQTTSRKTITIVQRLFLTFKPLSWIGWTLVTLFYVTLIFICFALMGFGLDKNNQFSYDAFKTQLHDSDTVIGLVFFLLVAILLRYLALWDYKRRCARLETHPAPVNSLHMTA